MTYHLYFDWFGVNSLWNFSFIKSSTFFVNQIENKKNIIFRKNSAKFCAYISQPAPVKSEEHKADHTSEYYLYIYI